MLNNGMDLSGKGYFNVIEIHPDKETFEKIGFKFFPGDIPGVLKFEWPDKYIFVATETKKIKILCEGKTIGFYYPTGKLVMV